MGHLCECCHCHPISQTRTLKPGGLVEGDWRPKTPGLMLEVAVPCVQLETLMSFCKKANPADGGLNEIQGAWSLCLFAFLTLQN
jgi:hypothetical protein